MQLRQPSSCLLLLWFCMPLAELYFIEFPKEYKSANPTTVRFDDANDTYFISIYDARHPTHLDIQLEIQILAPEKSPDNLPFNSATEPSSLSPEKVSTPPPPSLPPGTARKLFDARSPPTTGRHVSKKSENIFKGQRDIELSLLSPTKIQKRVAGDMPPSPPPPPRTAEIRLVKKVLESPCDVEILDGADSPYGVISLLVTTYVGRLHLFSLYEDGRVSGDVSPAKLNGDARFEPNDMLYILPSLTYYFPCETAKKPASFPGTILWDKVSAVFHIQLNNTFGASLGHPNLALQAYIDPLTAVITPVQVAFVNLSSRRTRQSRPDGICLEFTELLILFPAAIWFKILLFSDGHLVVDPDAKSIPLHSPSLASNLEPMLALPSPMTTAGTLLFSLLSFCLFL
jgi:hypothetical protein